MKDSYGSAMNWYRAAMLNLNLQDEEGVNPKLEGPVLMVVAKDDPLSNDMAIEQMKKNVTLADLKVIEIKSGHWIQIEKKEDVNAALEDFIRGAA